jgi:23S rRNA (guanine745-N1)-methyltransferase
VVSSPVPAALLSALAVLRCPICGQVLTAVERSLRCPQRHSFDVARAGYVSLLGGRGAISGDDDEMARARDRFLSGGAYAPLLAAIGDLAAASVPALAAPGAMVLDAGCGPGYYLGGLLDRFENARGLGFDTSARSLRFAARAHPRAAAYTGDVFAPFPVADDAIDLLIDVFAPRHPEEFARVLRPDGALLVARPAADHLAELRDAVPGMVAMDPRKEERLHEALEPLFTRIDQRSVSFELALDPDRARDLVAMTPSARHVTPEELATRLAGSPPDAGGAALTVTVSVLISVHRPR